VFWKWNAGIYFRLFSELNAKEVSIS